jgi:hypothetical protein
MDGRSAGDEDNAADTAAGSHPLAFLARHYSTQAGAFLNLLDGRRFETSSLRSALEVLSRYQTVIPLKTYHALVLAYQAKAGSPDLLADALASANVVLMAIERSMAAWQALATSDQAARIAGLIELLDALRTAVELRFPDARASPGPGLAV